jgi:hypothetical protein
MPIRKVYKYQWVADFSTCLPEEVVKNPDDLPGYLAP